MYILACILRQRYVPRGRKYSVDKRLLAASCSVSYSLSNNIEHDQVDLIDIILNK